MKNAGKKEEPVKTEKPGAEPGSSGQPSNTSAPGAAAVDTSDPLITGGNVNTKSYSGGGASQNVTSAEAMADIPEFIPPNPSAATGGNPAADNIPGTEEFDDEEETTTAKKKEKKPFNPDTEDMSAEEKKSAAEKMAQGIMTGYKFINAQGERILKISDKKITKLQMNGEIDVSLTVPWDINQMISLGDYFQEYNKACDGVFVVDESFEKSVMPPLTRVLAKRGHGWSDEHYLMFMFGQDILRKGMQFREIKSSLNQILVFAKEQTELQSKAPKQQVAGQTVVHEQPYQQQPAPVNTENVHQGQQTHMTIQQAAVSRVDITTPKSGSGLPTYGSKAKVKKINQAAHHAGNAGKTVKNPKTAARTIIDNSKRKVESMNPVPTGEKKGKGRPPGSKNKPKLPS